MKTTRTPKKQIDFIARNDYLYWESISAGGYQNRNSEMSSSVGVIGELGAREYLEELGYTDISLDGILQRECEHLQEKHCFICDISATSPSGTRELFEVKARRPHQFGMQLIPSYLRKYKRKGISSVIFVKVDPMDYAYRIDGIEGLDAIGTWPRVYNMIGKAKCYTHPSFVKDGKGVNQRQRYERDA